MAHRRMSNKRAKQMLNEILPDDFAPQEEALVDKKEDTEQLESDMEEEEK